jgi:hypothetical protein
MLIVVAARRKLAPDPPIWTDAQSGLARSGIVHIRPICMAATPMPPTGFTSMLTGRVRAVRWLMWPGRWPGG